MKIGKVLALLAMASLAACTAGEDEEPTRRRTSVLPATEIPGVLILELSAASATATVNQQVILTAQGWLDAAKSVPVTAGTEISFAVEGHGTLSATAPDSDSSGKASVTLLASAPGAVTVSANIGDVIAQTLVSYSSASGGGGGNPDAEVGDIAIATSVAILPVNDGNPLNASDQATVTVTLSGNDVVAVPVKISATSGSVGANTLTTNAAGEVTFTYTSGMLAEDVVITAEAAGKTAELTIIILPGTPSTIEVSEPSQAVLGLVGSGSPESSVVTFTVKDKYGNLVDDSNLVTFSLNPALTGAYVSPVTISTNKGVVAPVVFSGTQAGTTKLVATVNGKSVSSAGIRIDSGTSAQVLTALNFAWDKPAISVFDDNGATTVDQASLTVTVVDQTGAGISGIPLNFAASSGNISAGPLYTDASGQVSVTYTAGLTAEKASISVSAPGGSGTASLAVLPGAPKTIAVAAPSASVIGTTNSGLPENSVVTFTVRDAYGNLVSDSTVVNFSLSPAIAGVTLSPASMTTFQGKVSPVITAGSTPGTARLVATVAAPGNPTVSSSEVKISNGLPFMLTMTTNKSSVKVNDGDPLNSSDEAIITVKVLNESMMPLPGAEVRFPTPSGGVIMPSTVITGNDGTATATFYAGTQSFRYFGSTNYLPISAVAGNVKDSTGIFVNPGPAEVIQCGILYGGSLFDCSTNSLEVEHMRMRPKKGSGEESPFTTRFWVTDRYGNYVSEASLTFQLSPALGDATVSPESVNISDNQSSNVVDVRFHAGTVTGTTRIVGSVEGTTLTFTTNQLTVFDGNPGSLTAEFAQSQVAVGQSVPLDISVKSFSGEPLGNVDVRIFNDGGGTVWFGGSPCSYPWCYVKTNAAGNVPASYVAWSDIGVGALSITAGGFNVEPVISVVAGAPSKIFVSQVGPTTIGVTGSSRQKTTSIEFSTTDTYGNPTSGGTLVSYTISPPLAGVTVSPSMTTGNRAVVQATAGAVAGAFQVVGTIVGTTTSISSNVINVVEPEVAKVSVTSSASSTSVYSESSSSDQATIVVTVRDDLGNVMPGIQVGLTASAGILSETSGLSDGSGNFTTTFTAGLEARNVVITANAEGVEGSAVLTVLPGDAFYVEAGTPTALKLDLDGSGGIETSKVTFTVRDQYGNLVTDGTYVNFTLSPALAGAVVTPTSMYTKDGKATTVVHSGFVTGTLQVVADVVAFGSPSATSDDILVIDNIAEVSDLEMITSASSITVYDDNPADLSDQATITVTVRDAKGLPVAGVPVMLTSSSGNLSAGFLVSDSAGTVTVTYTGGMLAEKALISAEAEGVVASTFITVVPGSAFVLEMGLPVPAVLGLEGSSTPSSSVIPVSVKDRYGNQVSDGTVVTFTLVPALTGASVAPVTITTRQGLISPVVHAGTQSGSLRLLASAAGRSVISSEIIIQGAPASQVGSVTIAADKTGITVNDGNLVNTSDVANLVITVRDLDGVVMPGVEVDLSASAGTLSDSKVTTDGAGTAGVTYTAGIVAELVEITAQVEGVAGTLELPVGPGAPFVIEMGSPLPAQIGIKGSGSTYTSKVEVTIKDQSGNPVSDSTQVTFRLEPSVGGATVSPLVATTHDGTITAVINSGTKSGTVRLVASVAGHSVTSGKITIFGGLPAADSFSLVVESGKRVMSGFGISGLTATLTVFMTDRFGNPPQPGTSVYVACEAGICGANNEEGIQTGEGGTASFEFSTAFANKVHSDPAWPTAKEDFGGFVKTNHTWPALNDPREGYVTVIAMATGQTGYKDLNGNNVFDFGDAVTADPAEPFLDINSNGIYDLFEDFWDYDGNGVFDNHLPASYHAEQYIWSENTIIYATSPNMQMVPQQYIDLNGDGIYDWGIDLAAIGGPVTATNDVEFRNEFPLLSASNPAMRLQPGYASYVSIGTTFTASFADDNNNPLPFDTTIEFTGSEGLKIESPPAAARTYGADYVFPKAPINFSVSEEEGELAKKSRGYTTVCNEIDVGDNAKYAICIPAFRF